MKLSQITGIMFQGTTSGAVIRTRTVLTTKRRDRCSKSAIQMPSGNWIDRTMSENRKLRPKLA